MFDHDVIVVGCGPARLKAVAKLKENYTEEKDGVSLLLLIR